MRAPRPVEMLVATALAAAVGVFVGQRRRAARVVPPEAIDAALPEASPVHVPVDAAPEVESGFAGWTVDDDDANELDDAGTTNVEALLALVPMTRRDEASLAIARNCLGPGKMRMSQGNPDISTHPISREQCKAALRGVVLQTPLQREICGGPWEVPIHTGDPRKAKACIDVFEYPNHPCVLPFVFSYAMTASRMCALAGKRLCTQEEWNTACEADPNGGPPSTYAYGNELDLSICHTGRAKSSKCDVDNALWKSCPTDTVPSGSFPKCRSRLGVFDQHGNVAEAMTRRENGIDWIQLKGSAFFYDGKMYADHCRFDPRWHVDPANDSWHTNYHLGFRCCRTVVPLDERRDAGPETAPIAPPPKPVAHVEDAATSEAAVDDDPYGDDDD